MHCARPYVLLTIAAVSLLLGACGSVPKSRDDVLDPRLAGPCDRLILSWAEDQSRLSALMDDSFEPRTANGDGEFQLNVLRCEQQSESGSPLAFAFLSVPLSVDSAPIVITQMRDDGWAWLPAMIVNSDSLAVFSDMGYQLIPAEIVLEGDRTGDHVSITAQLMFEAGGISIAARTADKETSYTASQALVSTDPQYHSVLFGKETAARHELVSIAVDVEGETPLASINLNRQPERAVLDRGLRLDHVYWRLPQSQPESEPPRNEEP